MKEILRLSTREADFDARLARLHMPTKLVDHFEVVRLVKTKIMAPRIKARAAP